MTSSQSDESLFLMVVVSFVRYVSIQILLKFQPSISYNGGVMLE